MSSMLQQSWSITRGGEGKAQKKASRKPGFNLRDGCIISRAIPPPWSDRPAETDERTALEKAGMDSCRIAWSSLVIAVVSKS